MELTANDIMSHPVISIHQEGKVQELIALLHEKQITGVPVVDDHDHLVGVISITDLLSLSLEDEDTAEIQESDFHTSPAMDGLAEADGLLEPEDAVLDRPVQDFMSRQVITTSEQAPMGEIADLMVSHRVHRLIIVRDEKAAGIVSVMDILRALRDRHRAGA